jgi:TPR repeat protein
MELQRREQEQQQQYQQQPQQNYYAPQRSQPGYGPSRGARGGGGVASDSALAAFRRGDYATAYRLTLPAAQAGDRDAEYNMGILYKKGLGVRRDDAQAAMWYRRAALHGSTTAANDLALAYASGEGVPRDYVQSYVWLTRAAHSAGSSQDRNAVLANRRSLTAQMSPAQLAEAQRLTSGGAPPQHR